VTALMLIYKEQRFAASSLNDYGEIHQSLHNVISFIFWAVMTIILQIFLKIDVTTYILPFVTMLLTVSFALGPLIGNLFLSITFVFFMIPYDIGNKIVIGVTSDKITGGDCFEYLLF
jgi:small-conductance mechanosensitive channel